MFGITAPAILFPAITLILLAYTAKLIHLGNLVRILKSQYLKNRNPSILKQIKNLKQRIYLIRDMQICGILSFIFGVLCMFALFADFTHTAQYCFGFSLILLLIALFLSFLEIQLSASALKIEIAALENRKE